MIHSTNYINTFIEVAEDCPVTRAEIPPLRGEKRSIANLQFEMVYDHPYQFTSDDVVFGQFATRNMLAQEELQKEREHFFSKGQPCLRSSPLAKRYGWGIHSNPLGYVAIYAMESADYDLLKNDSALTHVKAMRTKKRR